MKNLKKCLSAMSAFVISGLAFAADIPLSTIGVADAGSAVVLGEWHGSFEKCKQLADSQNIPMIAYLGTKGCSRCYKLTTSLIDDEFVNWRKGKNLILLYMKEGSTGNGYGDSSPGKKWIKSYQSEGGFPYLCYYWKKPDGTVVSRGYGKSATQLKPAQLIANAATYFGDAVNSDSSYEPAEPSEPSEPEQVDPTPTPTPTPEPTPAVDPNTVFAGNVNLSAVCYAGDTPVGVLTVKAAKARSGKSKVSGYIYDIYGKKHALTAKYVATGANAKETFSVRGFAAIPSVALTFGKSSVSGTFANGGTVVQAKVGGSLSASTVDFSADAGLGDADSLFASGFEVIQDLLPHEGNPEPVSVLNGTRFSARKAASIKYVKSGGEYVLSGTEDARKPNKSALKLSYKSATGTFSGSYKIYASDACCIDSGKPKLKKLSVKVTGFVVDGHGYGVVTYRNKAIGNADFE